jgi:hypothetical protein
MIDDLVVATLSAEGYIGSLNDMVQEWLEHEGATGETLNELWHNHLDKLEVPRGRLINRWKSWLNSLGHTNDSLSYWTTR